MCTISSNQNSVSSCVPVPVLLPTNMIINVEEQAGQNRIPVTHLTSAIILVASAITVSLFVCLEIIVNNGIVWLE